MQILATKSVVLDKSQSRRGRVIGEKEGIARERVGEGYNSLLLRDSLGSPVSGVAACSCESAFARAHSLPR